MIFLLHWAIWKCIYVSFAEILFSRKKKTINASLSPRMCLCFFSLDIVAHINKNQNFLKNWHVKYTIKAPMMNLFNHKKSISLRPWNNVDWIIAGKKWRFFSLSFYKNFYHLNIQLLYIPIYFIWALSGRWKESETK